MSTVLLATDHKHERKVAIKVLREDLAGSAGAGRFHREIEIAAHLSHPNILPLLDSGEVDRVAYYIMPYVEGESLDSRLKREHTLPIDGAVSIAIECADALDYAHRHGIVHRDIKPGNILLSDGHAVLADFGIARSSGAATHELTATGAFVGTPAYMSPEQATGGHAVDGRSDIYSLGCVLYEMIVGEPPFAGPTPHVAVARQAAGTIPSIGVARPGISPELKETIRKALQKTPADRFPNARAFADALRASARPRAETRKSLRTATALAGVLLLAGAVWVVAQRAEPGRTEPDASPGGPMSHYADGPDPAHLAILPFSVVGGGEELANFAESLHGRLIDGLAAIDALKVISELGVRPYAGAAIPVDSIARSLRVGTLVAATVEGDGDSVRVRLRLVDGQTGEHLATRLAAAAMPERLSLMDAVGDSVIRYLRQSLGPTVVRRRQLLETTSLQAFERFEWARERHDEFEEALRLRDVPKAEAALQAWDSLLAEAERLDPQWLDPTVKRGAVAEHRVMLERSRGRRDLEPIYLEGLGHAERALAKSPGAPSALQLRGRLRLELWRITRDPSLLELAEHDLRAAVHGNAHAGTVFQTLSEMLLATGRNREALIEAERGYERDPYLANTQRFYLRLYEASFALGQDESASEWCLRGGWNHPGEAMFQHCRLRLMAWSGLQQPEPDTAWALLENSLALTPEQLRHLLEPDLLVGVAAVLARAGLPDSARAVLRWGREHGVHNAHDAATQAGVLIQLGDTSDAIELVASYLAAHPQDRLELSQRRELTFQPLPPELQMLLEPPSPEGR